MNTIIALMGISKRGKSPTIKLVEDNIHSIGYTNLIGRTKPIPTDPNAKLVDFEAIYENPKTKKRIGLCSVGDTDQLVRDGVVIELIQNHNCEICICTARSDGATHDVLETVRGYTTLYYPKTVEKQKSRQDAVNLTDARGLIEIARRMQ